MISEKASKTLVERVLAKASKKGGVEVEVIYTKSAHELTRFAESQIHQSVSIRDQSISVRLIFNKQIGVARTNVLSGRGIDEVVDKAWELARLQRPDESFVNLPSGDNPIVRRESAHSLSPLMRAKGVAEVVKLATGAGLTASGAFSHNGDVLAIGNSNGVWCYKSGDACELSTVVTGAKSSGYASCLTRDGSEIDAERVGRAAVAKATSGELVDVPEGEYEVLLESAAVAELLDFFTMYGPNARIYHEDVSFYQGNMGKQLFDKQLTIMDDPLDERGFVMPFDYEGYPKQRMSLVKNGVLSGVTYDSYLANKYHHANTGHALPAPNVWGPIATHLVVEPGTKSVEQMISTVEKGILVTRFWYTRIVHHKEMILTGMTRDGTFWIENGKIIGRTKNLRYTDSVLRALRNIKLIGRDLTLVGSEGSPSLVPAILLPSFRFTGVSQHT